jgi:hypothetical protein
MSRASQQGDLDARMKFVAAGSYVTGEILGFDSTDALIVLLRQVYTKM